MERLVLKGGNLLDLVWGIGARSSMDLDFSIEDQFDEEHLDATKAKIEKVLKETFRGHGYEVFDLEFAVCPENVTGDMRSFWGGYRIEFKVIESDEFVRLASDRNRLRLSAADVGPGKRKRFMIDISKFEYCASKRAYDVEGFTVYGYTLEMVVCEKLRSICQQMPEYVAIVKRQATARARDFFDIYCVLESSNIDLQSPENLDLLGKIFAAKRVPLQLLGKVQNYREFHRPDFVAVANTVKPSTKLKDFDFYFDYVVTICETLKSLWKE
jgi:hypothetical protein